MGALGCWVAAAIERAEAVEHAAKMEAERQLSTSNRCCWTPSPTTPVRRTGMGLPIAKAIVASQGGTMEVASPLGSGSVFTFSLPLDPCPAASEEVLRSDY
jgi:nitrogen-specific signal transduction histidine kinase